MERASNQLHLEESSSMKLYWRYFLTVNLWYGIFLCGRGRGRVSQPTHISFRRDLSSSTLYWNLIHVETVKS